MKTLLPLFVFTAVVACAPAPEIKHREPLFKKTENLVVLSEKADRDMIQTKFNNSIGLKCDFFIDNRADFNIALTTPDQFAGFTVNLAKEESPANLVSTMLNKQIFTTGVRVKKFDILPEVTYVDEKGVTHIMKNSPVVELVARGRDVLGNRDERFQKRFTLNEKSQMVITDLYPSKYPHILKCELVTKVDAAYESDYTVIQPAPAVEETKIDETPVVVEETTTPPSEG